MRSDEDTDAIIDDDDDDVFGGLQFRSFKRHKQMQEDYALIDIEDPADVPLINAGTIFPVEKVTKEAVEVVPVTKNELQTETKKLQKQKVEQKRADSQLITSENAFIRNKQGQTVHDLNKRETELEDLIKRKQERSKKEFEMKKEVLRESFKASVDSLIKRVRKQKEIITSSYGPIVLNSKKIEKPIFEINKELDPEGHNFIK